MLTTLSDTLAPHYCCSCGKIGAILCDGCKYDITSEAFSSCLVCLSPVANHYALCQKHRTFVKGASVVGWRAEALEKLIDASKFSSARAGCYCQAELLGAVLPEFSSDVTVVPVPTIRPHVRRRGYGHAEKVAKVIAFRRGYRYADILERNANFVQHGASRADRERQARQFFRLDVELDKKQMYIVVDDVYTTGATMRAIVRLLRAAGARDIWLAVTSRQPRE